MGTLDKVVRIIVAIAVVILYVQNIITGTLAIVLLVLSGIFVLTSLISFCPLYLPFGLKTSCKKKQE